MAIPKNTHRFIPRSDIIPKTKPPTSEKKPDLPAVNSSSPNSLKRSLLPLAQPPFQPILFIFLLLFIVPLLRNDKGRRFKTSETSLGKTFNTPDTIINMLTDVSPYLGSKEQESIQVIVGTLEAVSILKNILDGTYRNPRIMRTMSSSLNTQEKTLGLIKALKPYIPLNNHEAIDKALQAYSAVNKVSENIVHHYSSKNSQNSEKHKIADRIVETLNVINPLVPPEQQQRLNQIQKMMKIYEAMESSQLWEKWTQQEEQQTKAQKTSKDDKSETDSNSKDQKNITDTLKSALKPEQSQALEVMMKMAQLLAQKSPEKENEED